MLTNSNITNIKNHRRGYIRKSSAYFNLTQSNLTQLLLFFIIVSLMITLTISVSVRAEVDIGTTKKLIKLCNFEVDSYPIILDNKNPYPVVVDIELSGPGSRFITLSTTRVFLTPDEKREIYAFVNPNYKVGDYPLIIYFHIENDEQTKKLEQKLVFVNCQTFNLSIENDTLRSCYGENTTITMNVRNIIDQELKIGIKGKRVNEEFVIEPNQTKSIIINKVYRRVGNLTEEFVVKDKTTGYSVKKKFKVEVLSCGVEKQGFLSKLRSMIWNFMVLCWSFIKAFLLYIILGIVLLVIIIVVLLVYSKKARVEGVEGQAHVKEHKVEPEIEIISPKEKISKKISKVSKEVSKKRQRRRPIMPETYYESVTEKKGITSFSGFDSVKSWFVNNKKWVIVLLTIIIIILLFLLIKRTSIASIGYYCNYIIYKARNTIRAFHSQPATPGENISIGGMGVMFNIVNNETSNETGNTTETGNITNVTGNTTSITASNEMESIVENGTEGSVSEESDNKTEESNETGVNDTTNKDNATNNFINNLMNKSLFLRTIMLFINLYSTYIIIGVLVLFLIIATTLVFEKTTTRTTMKTTKTKTNKTNKATSKITTKGRVKEKVVGRVVGKGVKSRASKKRRTKGSKGKKRVK